MDDWMEWFKRHGDYAVVLHYYGGSKREVSVEELYQAFKARFEAERSSDQPGDDHA